MPKTPLAAQCIPMSKQQILKAIRLSAKKLGRNPSLRDLRQLGRVSEQVIYKRFGGLGRALAAAGLKPPAPASACPNPLSCLTGPPSPASSARFPACMNMKAPDASATCLFTPATAIGRAFLRLSASSPASQNLSATGRTCSSSVTPKSRTSAKPQKLSSARASAKAPSIATARFMAAP